jgi:hypothetical protein
MNARHLLAGLVVGTLVCCGAVQAALIDVTAPTDPMVRVDGQDDGDGIVADGSGNNPPPGETVDHALDDNTDKYLNFLDLNSGFIVTPAAGLSVVEAVRFYTANDAEPRDPGSYSLSGSNDTGADPSTYSYTLISSGNLSLPSGRNASGQALNPSSHYKQEVTFTNTTAYTTYKLIFPTVKNLPSGQPAGQYNSMQIGEVELMGTIVPEPSTLMLFGVGALGLLVCAWRRRKS